MNTLDLSMATQTTEQVNTTTLSVFKTDRGFNINIAAIAKLARESVQLVQLIAVPAQVRRQRRKGEQCETPILSEIGGGPGHDFCQVIAGTDARPINIDNVHYVNSDPAKASINHGSASVEIGSYFALGWKRQTDSVILVYRVVDIGEYQIESDPVAVADEDDTSAPEVRPIALLTCELQGHAISTWKGRKKSVPQALMALFSATEHRMTTDYHAPFFMEVIRMAKATDESREVARQMKDGVIGTIEELSAEDFMAKVTDEILDIRRVQYGKLPKTAIKRRVDPLHAVETLTLDREMNTIAVELVFPRNDDAMPIHFRLVLTAENFTDEDGRMSIERGLALNKTTFESLLAELEGRRDAIVVVNLTSIR